MALVETRYHDVSDRFIFTNPLYFVLSSVGQSFKLLNKGLRPKIERQQYRNIIGTGEFSGRAQNGTGCDNSCTMVSFT